MKLIKTKKLKQSLIIFYFDCTNTKDFTFFAASARKGSSTRENILNPHFLLSFCLFVSFYLVYFKIYRIVVRVFFVISKAYLFMKFTGFVKKIKFYFLQNFNCNCSTFNTTLQLHCKR